jgi:hypothetical protein
LRTGVADTVYIGTNTFGNGDFIDQRPDCVAGVPGFGEIFNTLGNTLGAGTSRQIQFALKFSF